MFSVPGKLGNYLDEWMDGRLRMEEVRPFSLLGLLYVGKWMATFFGIIYY